MRSGPRVARRFRACPAVLIAFPLEPEPLFALIRSQDRPLKLPRSPSRCSFTAILPCCSAAWPAPLPLSTFTAFLGFYCLCRLLLNQSTVADFVDFYCLCRLLLPLSTFTACVGFHCLCLILLSLSTMLTLTTECRNLLIGSTILL